jgi:hypothetical protein
VALLPVQAELRAVYWNLDGIQITCDIYGKWIPTQNLVGVNKLDSPQQSATQTQPAKKEKTQVVDFAP